MRSPIRRARPTIPPATPPAIAVEFDLGAGVWIGFGDDVAVKLKEGVSIGFGDSVPVKLKEGVSVALEAIGLTYSSGWPVDVVVGTVLGTESDVTEPCALVAEKGIEPRVEASLDVDEKRKFMICRGRSCGQP